MQYNFVPYMFKVGYIIFALTFSLGLFGMFYAHNYLRRIISFAALSNSLIVLFITIAYKQHSIIPIHDPSNATHTLYTDPLPSVLMLTAIVVGISIQSIALALYLSFSKKHSTKKHKKHNTQPQQQDTQS